MGPGGTIDDLRRWLESRFVDVEVSAAGALTVFGAPCGVKQAQELVL